MKTTLNAIRKYSPCADGWIKLLKHLGKSKSDSDPLDFSVILESNGIDDAIWCMRALPKKHWKQISLYSCDIAEHVLVNFQKLYPDDKRPEEAIHAARQYILGKITLKELKSASARSAAAWSAERKYQSDLFIKYFGKDEL